MRFGGARRYGYLKWHKRLYPIVAKMYHDQSVECGNPHAIEVAWSRGKLDTLDELFGYTVNGGKGKLTNLNLSHLSVDIDMFRRRYR